ncbi:MAG: insulinase family protein [Caulobacteraceae bacterium]
MRSALAALAALAALTPVWASPASGAASTVGAIHPDPAILRGVLANGVRYAVMHNANPSGGTSIRLGVAVGSLDEADDERGAAHFVEHLTFDGPSVGPDASLEGTFAAAGVAFGRDRNAATDYRSTVYRIDLPRADPPALDLAFKWLRQVADGGRFTDAAVNQERGVILAEREARMTATQSAAEAINRFQTPGLRFVDRAPIGTVASIGAMTAARLNGFYQRWYRPENAVVVVVGDERAATLEAKVRSTFGSWTHQGLAPAHLSAGLVDDKRGLDVVVRVEPTLPTALSVCAVRPRAEHEADDVARLRRRTLVALWATVLQTRLSRLAQDSAGAILEAQLRLDTASPGRSSVCVIVVPTRDAWRTALPLVEAELRRFGTAGPSEDDLEGAIRALRADYRGAVPKAATQASPDLAGAIVDDQLAGDVTATPGEAFAAFDTAVADLTPAGLKSAFNGYWSGAGPLIALLTPRPTEAAEVTALWKKGAEVPLAAARAPGPSAAWAYASFGRSGRIARRESFATPAFTRVAYANGVTLNFMHTDFVKDQVKVAVAFGVGRREIPDRDRFGAELGAGLFKLGGLGRHDYAQIETLFGEQAWGAELKIDDFAFLLKGSTTASGLAGQLELLAAYLNDPGFRDLDPLLATALEAFYRNYRTHLDLVANVAFYAGVAPNGPANLPPRETLARLRTADFERLLKPALTRAPLEVTIVGDVDEKTAVQQVANTFGALPPRRSRPREQAETWFLRFGDQAIAPMRVTHEGPAEKALIEAVWPLYVATPRRRREEIALGLLAKVFSDSLRHRLRDGLGKTYGPDASTRMPDLADQGFLQAVVETAPIDVDAVLAEIRRAAADLAAGAFTDADLEIARGPELARLAAAARTNDWWIAALERSARDGVALKDLLAMRDLTASITPAEVRKAAADWLSHPPIVVIVTPKIDPAVRKSQP